MRHHRESGRHNRSQITRNKRETTKGIEKEFQHSSPQLTEQPDGKSVKGLDPLNSTAWPLAKRCFQGTSPSCLVTHILFACVWFVPRNTSHMPSHAKGLHWKGIKLYRDSASLRDCLCHPNSEQELAILHKPQCFWTPSVH